MFENKGDIRNSIKAIIINNNKILLTHNEYGGEQFYLLPGGGQNHGETIIDALKRECLEEVNSSVDVLRLRFIREYIGKNHQFASEDSDVHQVELMFECRLIDDNLKLTEN
ncbi:MAG: NUDIX domain-containing protein, partial [Bacillota bacterium]|nr:NUDIX domain-containing protein [Bacillota bacterium]